MRKERGGGIGGRVVTIQDMHHHLVLMVVSLMIVPLVIITTITITSWAPPPVNALLFCVCSPEGCIGGTMNFGTGNTPNTGGAAGGGGGGGAFSFGGGGDAFGGKMLLFVVDSPLNAFHRWRRWCRRRRRVW